MKTKKQHWLMSLTQLFTLAALLVMPLAVHGEPPPLHALSAVQFSAAGLGSISAPDLPKFAIPSVRLAGLGRAVVKLPGLAFRPVLAQAAPTAPVDNFLTFLAKLFLVIGAIMIAYGGYEISRGRVVEGFMCTFGGLLLALAIPTMKWLTQIAAAGA